MITVSTKSGKPIMQGKTTMEKNEIFSHYGETGFDVICKSCSYPFANSVQEIGSHFDTVICANCEKEIAAIIVPEN